MRFDDMIATVLALPDEGGGGEGVAKWRQLVDLLAQRRGRGDSEQVGQALAWLRANRDAAPFAVRQDTAAALAGRDLDPLLVAYFAEDHPAIAEPLTGGAQAAAGTTAPDSIPLNPGAEAGEAQIRELIARIAAYRREKEAVAPDPVPLAPADRPPVDAFRWETGADGIILWVDGAPRGPLVGQSIASAADPGQFGVDGQAAGAFEKRSPFRDARFSVAGTGPGAGDWRISGVPFFDPQRGYFLGYRGSARRPRLDEVARPLAAPQGAGIFGTQLPADSLRQLIHELRTPLNAIVGFAEMIDGQYMGPAATGYRNRASQIMEQATRLLSAVDDLDTAARIETSRLTLDDSSVDAVALICRLHDAYERVASQRNSSIAIDIARDLPLARVEAGAAERMFARILAATIGLAGDGETISAAMGMEAHGGEPMLCLAIDRPRAIAGLEEAALLDPGYSPEGDWPGAPALGLGFALRLVRNLAEAVGGALAIGRTRFSLYLPPLEAGEGAAGQGGEGTG